MDTFNIVFEFISKSFSMFWAMKFKDKIKLLFEMAVLILLLILAGNIATSIVTELVRRIFMFLPTNILSYVSTFVENILYVGCLVIGAIVVIRMFKTRYLDYYVIITDDTVSERVTEEPIKELKEKKDYKIVIRDPEHSSRSFFKKIYDGFIIVLKVLALLMAIPVMITFVTAVMFFVISLAYALSGLFFGGISLAILGGIVFIYLILEFMYNLIFNRKHAYLRGFILFIVSLVMIGTGFGLSFTSLKDFEVIDDQDVDGEIEALTIDMMDDLILDDMDDIPLDNIVIDNNLNDIKVDVKTYGNAAVRVYTRKIMDSENDYQVYHVADLVVDYDGIDTFKRVLDDAKNKKIRTYYDGSYYIDKLYISEKNLTKIKENYKRLYD